MCGCEQHFSPFAPCTCTCEHPDRERPWDLLFAAVALAGILGLLAVWASAAAR